MAIPADIVTRCPSCCQLRMREFWMVVGTPAPSGNDLHRPPLRRGWLRRIVGPIRARSDPEKTFVHLRHDDAV